MSDATTDDDGAAAPRRGRNAGRPRRATELIVVHCAATSPDMDIGAREIDAWHRQRGFRMIGYHFVIRRSGGVEPGRRLADIGAHARGFNHASVGVCLVGGLDAAKRPAALYTPAQYDQLWRLLGELAALYPAARVLGHGDLPGVDKACPCFDVGAWAERRAAAERGGAP